MTTAVELPDAAARSRIAEELAATLFVEAGAGTGKTTALVGRVVEIVRQGHADLREIAAITFTEAAAFELRERLRQAVAEAADAAPDDARWQRARREVDEAVISTIHGFCQRILAEHPLEAGLPLRFEVLDDVAAAIAFDSRFSTFLDQLYDEQEARVLLAAASCLGITPGQLRLLALQLEEHAGSGPSAVPSDLAAGIEERTAAVVAGLVAAIDVVLAYHPQCRDGDDALARRVEELAELRSRLVAAADWMDALRLVAEVVIRRAGTTGRRENWDDGAAEGCREAIGALADRRAAGRSELADLVLSRLVARLLAEARRAAAARRAEGKLLFGDLLVLTDELLARAPGVTTTLRQRFRRIFVDEFQDTDPLQLRIVKRLATPERATVAEEGRLFFVGDPKQSIYRFRGADVGAYLAAQEELALGEATSLVANFRSVPGVLDFVNGVFAELLGKEHYPALEAVRAPLAGRGPVNVVGGALEQMSQSERRRLESAEVAAIIARAVAEGWPVADGDSLRPARFSDVALLVPRRTGLFHLERALEAEEVPYQVASSTLVYGSSEVRDLCAALAALAPGADERAVLAALRTPAFACSDEELVAFRFAGGVFRLGGRTPEGGPGAVADALAALTELHAESYRLGVVGLLERIVRERRVAALQASAPRREEALRRIDFVLERARTFTEAGGVDLGAFLSFLDLESRLGVRTLDLPSADEGEDVVKILTVHGAKGLEFPIVVLAELGGPINHRLPGPRVLLGTDGRIEARVRSGVETAGFKDLAESEEEAEVAEALRVAYVAATRARDHLVVALHHQPAKSDAARTLAERIAEVRPPLPAEAVPLPLGLHRAAATGEGALPDLDLEEWRSERRLLLARLARPANISATALVGEDEPVAHGARAEADPARWNQPRAATSIGRAVHKVLQLGDLADPSSLEVLSTAAATEEGCAGRASDVARLASAALESPLVARALGARRSWRELPITLALPGGVLEAVIDLCFEEAGGLVVVDYKTDALDSPAAAAVAATRYRSQIGAYVLALEALTGQRVAAAYLLFLAVPHGPLELQIEGLAGAAEEARSRATTALGAGSS